MKKMWWLGPLAALGLTACVTRDESTMIIDDHGRAHYTMHYLNDTRGRRHFPRQLPPTGNRLFVFDPTVPAWAAYDERGWRVMTGRASGGAEYCADTGEPCRTITGSFKVFKKGGEDCRSREFPIETEGGARMPYCMYFFRGTTIHAGYGFSGGNSSHGCIRVLPSAAKWLNEEFIKVGTQVIVLSYKNENGDGDWLRGLITY